MKTQLKLSGNKLKIFMILAYHDGCTVNFLLDKLAEYFGCYCGLGYFEKVLIEMSVQSLVFIDKAKNTEPNERRKASSQTRRYLYINKESDNPCLDAVEGYKQQMAEYIESQGITPQIERDNTVQEYLSAKRVESLSTGKKRIYKVS